MELVDCNMSILGKRSNLSRNSLAKSTVKLAMNPLQVGGSAASFFKSSTQNDFEDESKEHQEEALFFDEIDPNKSVMANKSMASDGFVQLSTLIEDYIDQQPDNYIFSTNNILKEDAKGTTEDLKSATKIVVEAEEVGQLSTKKHSSKKTELSHLPIESLAQQSSRSEVKERIDLALQTARNLIDCLPTKKKRASRKSSENRGRYCVI